MTTSIPDGGRPSAIGLARLLQFGEQAFPIGGFAFSNGLESAIQTRVVQDADTLLAFVRTATEQAATGDGVALIHAHGAACDGGSRRSPADRRAGPRPQAVERIPRHVDAHGAKGGGTGRACDGRSACPSLARADRAWRDGGLLSDVAGGRLRGAGTVRRERPSSFTTMASPPRSLAQRIRLMRIGHVETQTLLYTVAGEVDRLYDARGRPVASMRCVVSRR